jgi:dTMP kinase
MAPAEQLAGVFIALEGIDGSGKSTIARRLAAAAREAGLDVILTREPGGTAIGEQIRSVLLGARSLGMRPETEALLFAAARAQHVAELIRPALESGSVVITDRYTDSSLAYQCGGRELPEEQVVAAQTLATGGLEPNLKLLLDLPVELALQRRNPGADSSNRIDRESVMFHERVRKAYLMLLAADPERWRIVDAAQAENDVAESVIRAVNDSRLLPKRLPSSAIHSATGRST